jgi:protein-disulfide isomerase
MLNFFEVIYLGEQTTITLSKDTMYGAVIAVLACLLVVSVFTQGFGLVKTTAPSVTQPPANVTAPPANNTPAAVKTMAVPASLNLAPVMGPANSKIKLLEFSDFQCPYCGMSYGSPWTQSAQYASQIIPAITGSVKKFETDYVSTGKADFIHFPVAFLGLQNGVNESLDSADAAFCAQAQGKYFEMYNALFDAQTPKEGDGKYSKPNLKIIAQGVSGLNLTAFNACLDADTYASQVLQFTNEWGAASQANTGTAGTPTFYVLVDASKTTQDKVSATATAAGFAWGMSADKTMYVIIVDPEYAKIQQVVNALA